MLNVELKFEDEAGHSIEIVPTYFHPLGLAEISALPTSGQSEIVLTVEGKNAVVDGKPTDGSAQVKSRIKFLKPPSVYTLVQAGWLPPPFVSPPRFLVDRNVVVALRKLRQGKGVQNDFTLQWWTGLVPQGATFNPLPYAIEGSQRRRPTKAEFKSAYDEGARELYSAFPNSEIVQFDGDAYDAAYSIVEAFRARTESEVRFLLNTCPIVRDRLPVGAESDVRDRVFQVADSCCVSRTSLAVLSVLSCLYESPNGIPPAIGRAIVKPTACYTERDAFNALSDLRHIELAAAIYTIFAQEAFSLCTCDKALAMLWCALSLRGTLIPNDGINFKFELTRELFSRLDQTQLTELEQHLSL